MTGKKHMTPGNFFREYKKKMHIEEKCLKETKPILILIARIYE